MEPVRALISGAAGQLVYSLILQIGKGDVFGPDQPVILHLLDIPESLSALEGVVMEIEDCALPLIRGINIFSDPYYSNLFHFIFELQMSWLPINLK